MTRVTSVLRILRPVPTTSAQCTAARLEVILCHTMLIQYVTVRRRQQSFAVKALATQFHLTKLNLLKFPPGQ